MISIVFKKKASKLVEYFVQGHAEYELNNEVIYDDVVCGVVSNLAQTMILGVEEVLKFKAKYLAEDGYILLNLEELSETQLEKTQVLLETMLLALNNLEITYGEYIKVRVEEVQWYVTN